MKVLMLNGSARENGCTATALAEIGSVLSREGIDWEIVQLGGAPVRDCVGCGACRRLEGNACAFGDDIINDILKKAEASDGFVFGSPVYYAHPSGRILSVLDRLFYAGADAFRNKPGAAIVSARRAGTTASLDVLDKYFGFAQMPVAGSTYWNMVHGNTPDQVREDLEGLQTMRNLGRSLAWLLKCIALGREHGLEAPAMERAASTNFIRPAGR